MIAKLVAGLVLAAGVGTSIAVVNGVGITETDQAVVDRVVDGDTVDVRLDGVAKRIRLLNIDTPETVDPDRPVECLGPEATAYLTSLLPVGTPVTLKYDEERIDSHGRTLAAIFIADGTLVNAEIARQGLGAAVVIGDNDRFYPPVEEARDEAVIAERGLYSADVVCTVPAKVRAVTNAADSFAGVGVQATSAQLGTGASTAAAAVATAIGLEEAFADGSLGVAWSALPDSEQERLADLLTAGKIKAQRDELTARTAAASAREREEVARAAEVRRQREALERAAQEKRERQAARAGEKAAEQARQAEAAAMKGRTQQSDSSSSGGSSGPAGYTGPRCYAPGGKTWRPC